MLSCTAARVCAPVARPSTRRGASRRGGALVVRAGATVKSGGITVNSDPTEEEKQRASGWSTWACAKSKFDWQYSNAETCYLIKGSVTVTPEGGEPVTIRTGDIASFPAGMNRPSTASWSKPPPELPRKSRIRPGTFPIAASAASI